MSKNDITIPHEIDFQIFEKYDHQDYKNHYGNKNKQMFLPGEEIKGHFKIKFLTDEPIKYRFINILLIGQYFHNDQLISEINLSQMKKIDSGIINTQFESDIFFSPLKSFESSYYGYNYKLIYYIFINFSRFIRSGIKIYNEILLFDPGYIKYTIYPITISPKDFSYIFTAFLDKDKFFSNEIISGSIAFGNTKIKQILNVNLYLNIIEIFNNNKSEETTLCMYQLMDGNPKSGTTIPFILELEPFHICSPFRCPNALINLNFNLKFEIICYDNTIFKIIQPISIYSIQ